jgi:acetate kinase
VATLGGIDALVFTAGVGENAPVIRERVCADLACMGLEMDRQANADGRPDSDVAAPTSSGRILLIATREDLTIVRDVCRVLGIRKEAVCPKP